MALTFTQLFAPAQLTNAAVTYYTAPSTPTTIAVMRMRVRFANTDTGAHAVTAYAIQSGGSASAANCIANAETIAPNNHLDLDVPVLGPAGFFQAKADANTVVTISALDGVVSA